MLEVAHLQAGYGQSRVLFDVSLAIGPGEVVALLGRNGMGKTTSVATIMGLLPATSGTIRHAGASVAGLPPHAIAQRGIGLVPEGRQIFPRLSVEENLVATARGATPRWTLPRIWALFPRLEERRRSPGTQLSGGEQQMLAIGRALMTNPTLLILDEATEGLAPLIRAEIWATLAALKREGLAILLIDKHLQAVLRLADQAVVIEKGRTVWSGTSQALADAPEVQERWLHV
ncbi:MAG: ABC transporter ATP-binding protein [Rhodospirillales bacterium]|nr:ABC transporter ATP-binding protein [Rhodospirillales bacterium]